MVFSASLTRELCGMDYASPLELAITTSQVVFYLLGQIRLPVIGGFACANRQRALREPTAAQPRPLQSVIRQ
jgi:hypothetical protein